MNQITHELQLIKNYIGDAMYSEIPMNMDDLNELWQWIDKIMTLALQSEIRIMVEEE